MTVIVFERAPLLAALALVGRVQPWRRAEPRYEPKSGKPITPRLVPAVVRVHVHEGTATLTCANFDQQIWTDVRCEGGNATVYLPVEAFTAAITKSPEGALVELTVDSHSVIMRAGRLRVQMHAETQDFPPLSIADYPRAVTIDAEALRRGIGQVLAAAQEDLKRPWLGGVYLHDGPDGLAFTAMDSFRIHAAKATGGAIGSSAIIPRAAARLLASLLPENGAITVQQDDRSASFGWGETTLRTKLIDAQYPRVEEQLRRHGGHTLRAHAAALIADLDLVACVADAKLQEVQLNLGDACEAFATRVGPTGRDTGTIALDAEYRGAPMRIGFQLRLVKDALQHFGEREIAWRMGGPFDPTIISCPDLPGLEMMVSPLLPAGGERKAA